MSDTVELFLPVVQRRLLTVPRNLVPLIEPLFMIETHMTYEERLALFEVAAGLPQPFVACEVGSYLGSSACFLAAAACLRSGRVHCVDTWDNSAMGHEPLVDTYGQFLANTNHFRHFLTLHRGKASDVAQEVPGGLDLLFIDGDHSYEAAREDLRHYAPKLKPGGMLLLHDFHLEAVQRATNEHFAGNRPVSKRAVHSLQVFQIP